MKILFATSNEAKINIYKDAFEDLEIELLTVKDLEEKLEVEESGINPVENAKIKAKAYYDKYKIITLAEDDGLFIEKANIEEQPGNEIKRWTKEKVNDDDILNYYSNLLNKYDGKSKARIIKGAAIYDGYNYFTHESETERLLISKPSNIKLKGYPLSSLTYYENLGKYLTELSDEELKLIKINEEEGVHDFIKNTFSLLKYIKKSENSFNDLVKDYDMNNDLINLKYTHSLRVARIALSIAAVLKLSKEDQHLAYVIGLLHDIGRFYQVKKHDTFHDHLSLDHALVGADYLIKDLKIKNFDVLESDYNVIYKAVNNHNKLNIEENLTERELLFSKLIRDADKLDIFYQSTYRENILKLPNDHISEDVLEEFNNTRKITNINIKTNSDKNLQLFSLAFDLNFDYSKKYLKQENYIQKLYERLNSNLYDDVLNKINKEILDLK